MLRFFVSQVILEIIRQTAPQELNHELMLWDAVLDEFLTGKSYIWNKISWCELIQFYHKENEIGFPKGFSTHLTICFCWVLVEQIVQTIVVLSYFFNTEDL